MKMRWNTGTALLAVLLLAQVGCTGLTGVRFHEGMELAAASDAQPPHSRFHPVPTQPVFSPKPAATIVVAQRAELESASASGKAADVQPAAARSAVLASRPTVANLKTAEAISQWAQPSNIPSAAGPSSRRAPQDDEEVPQKQAEPSPPSAGAASPATPTWADRFGLGDGWRPRAGQ